MTSNYSVNNLLHNYALANLNACYLPVQYSDGSFLLEVQVTNAT